MGSEGRAVRNRLFGRRDEFMGLEVRMLDSFLGHFQLADDPELPPLKWSSLRYGFAMKEDNNGE